MSIGVMVYRVNIHRLAWLCEPERRDETRAQIVKRFGTLIAQRDERRADEIAEGCPTALEALDLLLTDQPCAPQWSYQLAYALELLCMYWGYAERNDQFSPTRWSYLSELQATLRARMDPEPLTPLLQGGSPIALPVTIDLEPAIGHLREQDIVGYLDRVPEAAQLGLESAEDCAAGHQLWLWLSNARLGGRDLVAFTY
jgi:hypothetical protein